jgi:hypothetical protein
VKISTAVETEKVESKAWHQHSDILFIFSPLLKNNTIFYLHPPHLQPGEAAVSLQVVEMTGQRQHHARLRHSNLKPLQAPRGDRQYSLSNCGYE